MAELAEARRMRLLEIIAERDEPQELDSLAALMNCDTRTIRRDLDQIQQILKKMQGFEIRRSRVMAVRTGYSPGYFSDQLVKNSLAKEAIARTIVSKLPDEVALALTAGSTPYYVAKEIRRAVIEGDSPKNPIVFTNSVPALLEMVSAGISTGVLGEIYVPEDCALHTPEFHSAVLPSVAIVGASGVSFGLEAGQGGLDLFSHRAEEAAFMKQLLLNIPEVIIAVDSAKLGKRHPWSFGGKTLYGKKVRLVTEHLTAEQEEEMKQLTERLAIHGVRFSYEGASRQCAE